MKCVTAIGKRFLVALLTAIMLCGNVPMQVAWAVEPEIETLSGDAATKNGESGAETESGAEKESAKESDKSDSKDEAAASSESKVTAPKAEKTEQTKAAVAATNSDSNQVAAVQTVEDQPYSIKATFGGSELNEGENDLGTWSDGTKALNITLTRNTDVPVDSGKTYVLSMSVSGVLYFNGIPKAENITGVEEVSFKKNAAPQVITGSGAASNYSRFSPYSGEIRMRLNATVNTVDIQNLGVNFDPQLVGYRTKNELANALNIKVVSVDSDNLGYDASSSNVQTLLERDATSVTMKNSQASSRPGTVRMFVSNDGFITDTTRVNQAVKISKGGTVSYSLGGNNMTPQVHGKLVIVLGCPYVTSSDGVKHYLGFNKNDPAILSNVQGTRAGFHMDSPAIVDEENHTITYTFTNVLNSEWSNFVASPRFSWPSDLSAEKSDDNSYQISGLSWEVTTHTSYLGAQSTLFAPESGELKPGGGATFVPDSVDLKLQSTAEAPKGDGYSNLAKFKPSSKLTDGSSTGALGFFDLHNDGVAATPEVKVEFNFNAGDSDGATYRVTRVNLPVGDNSSGTTVSYELSNGSTVVSGGYTYGASSNNYIACAVAALRSAQKVGSDYYISKVSYTTKRLTSGVYHTGVVDGDSSRFRSREPGLFSGWISGSIGQSASATMAISSTDGSSLTSGNDSHLEATEVSTISDDNSTVPWVTAATVDGSKSSNITAGQSTDVALSFNVTDEEYSYSKSINGYRVIENPTLYICLPEGAVIAGKDQATLDSMKATNVTLLPGSEITVNGVKAQWWEVRFDNANFSSYSAKSIKIQISTSRLMSSATWDFNNAIAFRMRGQYAKSANSAVSAGPYNTVSALTASTMPPAIQALGSALSNDSDANGKLGLVYWKNAESRTLNISRAEAKLDVSTSLSQKGQTASAGESTKVTDETSTLDYGVNVSSSEGGTASEFSYYIPIVKKGASLDASAFVTGNNYSLELMGEVNITGSNANGTALTDIPFNVFYTTEPNLTSSNIQTLGSDKWKTAAQLGDDFSQVTAVKIATKDDGEGNASTIWPGSSFTFAFKLGYDNSQKDFAANAGRSVAWRTFGHYTYTLSSGSETTNTYPSGVNSVKLGYISDRTKSPIDVTLDAGKGTTVNASLDLDQSFALGGPFWIKKITTSSLKLTDDDPSSFSGANANETFRIRFGLNDGTPRLLSQGAGGIFTIGANEDVKANIGIDFSAALSETAVPRYVDVSFGNADIDITVRINLVREYTPAAATDAGVEAGEHYSVPAVNSDVSVASNSAFTAVFPINGFVPSNYRAQKLKWKAADGSATAMPDGATVIMVGLKENNTPASYWLYRSTGASEIDLKQFKNMDDGSSFTYDTTSSSAKSLKYLFVVDFSHAKAGTGSYKIAFGADPVDGAGTFTDVDETVTLIDPGTYVLEASGDKLAYTVNPANGDESFLSGKTLALVVSPASGTMLPADARLSDGESTYSRNTKGEFVVPIGSIASGSKSLSLVSSQLPMEGANYKLDAKLMLVGSTVPTSPDAGTPVGNAQLTLDVVKSDKPSISVSGTRAATVADWGGGQPIALKVQDVPEGASVIVTAYQGLIGNVKVTDLLSSVDGRFTIKNGSGTYNPSEKSAGKLWLSSAAKPGTYRLVFEVKKDSATLLTVPYAIIVR